MGRGVHGWELPPGDLDTWDRAQREASILLDDILDLADSYGITTETIEPGSPLAQDLDEGLTQAAASDAVPSEVVARDLAERAAASATIHQEEDWFIARSATPDVASQGRTEGEARANLREAVELYLASQETT